MTIEWPSGFERTPAHERRTYPHGFQVDMQQAFRNIVTQLERMDVDDWRISSGTDHRSDKPHLPYASAPHVVLGVEPDAGAGEVRSAFRDLVQDVHPDRGGDQESFERVQQARNSMLGL